MYEQIASNKRRSIFLLFGFLLVLGGLAYVISLVLNQPDALFVIGVFALFYAT